MTPEEVEGFPGVTRGDIALARATLATACGNDPPDGLVWRIALAIHVVVEDERERCAGIADRCAAERRAQLPEVEAAGGNVDAVVGKLSEAERIAEAIRKETK